MSQTAYEIYGRGFGWTWRLRVQDVVVAHGGDHYEQSSDARAEVDRVRAAVAFVRGDLESFPEPTIRDPQVAVERDPTPAGEFPAGRDHWVWRLETVEGVLAHSADRFPTERAAQSAADHFLANAVGGLPTFMVGAEYDWQTGPAPVEVGAGAITGLLGELARGVRHRNALDRFDSRIVVAGSRGKSTTARRLDDVFNRRGYDTLTKITGDEPVLIHNGEVHPIDRTGPRTLLYENARIVGEYADRLAAYEPDDVAIFENQGITPYTTRLVNRTFLDADVVLVTNVRQDHVGTLGKKRVDVARAFGRAVPSDAHVICGEQHPDLAEYLRAEAERRGATVERVEVPEAHEGLLGAEIVHAINPVLDAVGEPPVPESELESYLETIQPEWTHLPGGRVYDAASVNDVESTEMVRRALVDDGERILPFVFLRRDRRGRTASFGTYVETLAERDLIDEVHVGGANTTAFANTVDVPVTTHDGEAPGEVLDDLLGTDLPVVLMGNAVDDFMRQMEGAIAERAEVRRTGARLHEESSLVDPTEGSRGSALSDGT